MAASPDKVTKRDADYGVGKPAEHCGNCKFFQPGSNPFAVGTCKKVLGAIQWHHWCRLWERK